MATRHIVAMIPPAWGHVLLPGDPTDWQGSQTRNHYYTAQSHGAGNMPLRPNPSTYNRTSPSEPDTRKEALEQLDRGWMENIPKLAQGSEGWPKPKTIHFDFATGANVIEPTKKIVGPTCKTLLWFSGGVVSMISALSEHDFVATAEEIYNDEARPWAWNGADKLIGRVLKFPGAPDMYDYERVAYAAGPPAGMIAPLISGQKLAKLGDGYISPTSTCIEPIGVPCTREYYKTFGQEVFTVGMQVHEHCWTDVAAVSPKNEVVRSFLDSTMSQHGPGSALYISFGSFFFPVATPELVKALIDTLLQFEQPFPFIFALGGTLASLPAELIQRVNTSGKGLICDFWVEQRAILQNGAVGWFLTHGGYNSFCESLSQGIPLIIWPAGAEQPVNAALFSSGPKAIRTGPQRAPSLRGGPKITGSVEDASEEFKTAFADARGARGMVLQANAAKLAKDLRKAHTGEASDELMRLAKFCKWGNEFQTFSGNELKRSDNVLTIGIEFRIPASGMGHDSGSAMLAATLNKRLVQST
ncbi:hypothetical protein C8R43DRAFT_957129 [Mycena crocata]|nr:hypothetical protein C8R43DRAFT_957129 [Mycena crocata]